MAELSQQDVYFTWPDGVFSYECRGCGACCKGLGIGLDAVRGELAQLLEHNAGLEAFVRKRGATWTVFNPRGRCWFLDDEGWCRVEREHGREAKPASCRLFPFNRVFKLGSSWVVDFNAVICPLRALPEGATEEAVGLSGRVTHASILEDIAAVEDPAVVGVELPQASLDAEAFVARERAVSAGLFELASSGSVSEAEMAEVLLGEGAEAGLAQRDEALAALLGGPPEAPSEETLRNALWSLPSLRFNETFGRRAYLRPWLESDLGLMGLTWARLLGAGEAVAGRPLSMQEVTSVWGEVVTLLVVASRWKERPVLPRGPVELDTAEPMRTRLVSFARACVENSRRRRTLGALMAPLLSGDVHERVASARLLEPLLAKMRFVGPGGGGGKGRRRKSKGRRKRRG